MFEKFRRATWDPPFPPGRASIVKVKCEIHFFTSEKVQRFLCALFHRRLYKQIVWNI